MGVLLILIIYFSVLIDQVFKYHLEYSRNRPLFHLPWTLPIPEKFTSKIVTWSRWYLAMLDNPSARKR